MDGTTDALVFRARIFTLAVKNLFRASLSYVVSSSGANFLIPLK